ncbi:MAG: hypothetical protein AAF628_29710 [Planctomycetota bacterium]
MLDVLILPHSHTLTLDVANVFGRGAEPELHVWTTEVVTAPAWHWHIVAAAYAWVAALFCWVGRGRPAGAPSPVPYAVATFAVVLVAGLALEKAAAHPGIVWAVGTSAAVFYISPFFGYYCGVRGTSVARWLGALAIANLVQRLLLIAVAWVATTQQLGTHLDVHTITDIAPPGLGEIVLQTPVEAWTYAILMPQLAFQLVVSMVFGVVLGAVPFVLARRRARSRQ